jgi:hypothetical protein
MGVDIKNENAITLGAVTPPLDAFVRVNRQFRIMPS